MFFQKKEKSIPPTDLSHIIYEFIRSDKNKHIPEDYWQLVDAVRGLQIFGGIGSGKSSGSGRAVALELLQRGYSGVVLTGKVDEKEVWIQYAKETGRLNDLIIFEPGGPYKFNPLQYELDRDKESGGGHTDNIVALFLSIVKMGNRMDGNGNGMSKEPFWIMAMERCLKADIDLLKIANKGMVLSDTSSNSKFEITITNIAKILRDTPSGPGHYERFLKLSNSSNFELHNALQKWANQSYTIYCLTWALAYIKHLENQLEESSDRLEKLKATDQEAYTKAVVDHQKKVEEFESEERIYEAISSYFLSELPKLAEKTRSSIMEHFFAFAAPFRSGMLADYFATTTSNEVLPEETFNGKIIVLNFPVKKYLQLGVYAQCIYKKIWQQAIERRAVDEETIPAFMWIDESQYFINPDDVTFQTTARSSKACTVLITQNISNYYAAIGGSNSKAFVDSLLGNLATKIFHNNNDAVMNEWAAETIGKDYRGNVTSGDGGVSVSDEYQYQYLPKNFTLLKTGGEMNEGNVEAIITVAGKKWSTGKNFLKIKFQQNLES